MAEAEVFKRKHYDLDNTTQLCRPKCYSIACRVSYYSCNLFDDTPSPCEGNNAQHDFWLDTDPEGVMQINGIVFAVKNGIPTSRCLRWLLVLLTLVHQPRGASDYLQLFNSAQVQQLPSPSPINLLPCVPRPPDTNSHCLIPSTVAASSFQNPSVRLTNLRSLCTTVQRHPTKWTFIALHSQQASSITMSTQHLFAIIFHFGLQKNTEIVTNVMSVLSHLPNVTHQCTVSCDLFECNQLTYVCSRSVYILQFTITKFHVN